MKKSMMGRARSIPTTTGTMMEVNDFDSCLGGGEVLVLALVLVLVFAPGMELGVYTSNMDTDHTDFQDQEDWMGSRRSR
jgi:hypothetical protein